ncbi:MFS transporter [Paraconexibacter antarcticus]|uniref:MFS transporter n=1 Tax=Paraconexibacter antarcticus TaxID=2949664 RepID=A0ABY5DNZ1_9ACTN|nr:MFS transporter [Paraconexibacter antarcticus]UTI62532.1 MFS transporter [Paraconexibacter antarcticus]
MSAGLRRSVASLRIPNFRRFFTGQVISVSGSWMQTVAEAWLVLSLTSSGVALGVSTALQFLPMLLLGAYGGLLADRFPKRRVLVATQTLMILPALTLFVLTVSGVVTLWMVYALVLTRGLVTAIDNPTRQSFISEMVGPGSVVNAVSLNGVLVQTARIAGPAAAAAVIALSGVATCFLLNALSFGAMLLALSRMDPAELHDAPPSPRGRGQIREALTVVRGDEALWVPLATMAVVSMLAYNFQTVLPLLAKYTFHGGASTYALLMGTMGAGAIVGALVNGARAQTSPALISGSAVVFGGALGLAAVAPTLDLVLAALVIVGAASVTFTSAVNAQLQLAAPPALRGRVMALYGVVFLGSTPIGAPILGAVCEHFGARTGLAVGAVAAAGAGVAALTTAARQRAHLRAATHPVAT